MEKYVTYNGAKIFYRIKKHDVGSCIVFVHGWGGNMHSFTSIESFFISNYTCVFISLPMFQLSDRQVPTVPWTLESYAAATKAVLIREKITSFHIMAHSFGARVAVLLNSHQNFEIKRMVLTGAAGMRTRRKITTGIKILFYKIKKKFFKKTTGGSSDYKALTMAGKITFQNIIKTDLTSQIKVIKIPTLLIFGKKDKTTKISAAKKWTKLCGSATLITYENCGHFCFIDKPSRFVTDTQSFIGEV